MVRVGKVNHRNIGNKGVSLLAFDYFVADNIRTNDEKRKRPCVLQQTLEFDDSYCIAEADACAGRCSRCV